MNYVELHIGDYEKATAHLTACEDGMYGRLLRRYYDTEAPLPTDLKALQRFVRARTRDEKEAVESVLKEFFTPADDGWHHKRCDEEIAKYQLKREKAQRSANARWNTSERNANAYAEDMRTHCEGNAHQSPVTSHQSPEEELDLSQGVDPKLAPTEAGRACQLLKQAGCARFNSSHPDLLAALREGVTPEAIRDTYLENPNKKNPFAYAIATARSRHAEGATAISTGPPSIRAQAVVPMSKTLQALHNLEAAKHAPGLDHPGDQLRIAKADFVEP